MNCELSMYSRIIFCLSLLLPLDSAFKAQVRIEFTSPFSDCILFALLIEVKVSANDKPTTYNSFMQLLNKMLFLYNHFSHQGFAFFQRYLW